MVFPLPGSESLFPTEVSMSKSISEMTEDELLAELHRLESIKVPKSPTPKAPQNRKVSDAEKAAKGSKRAPWKQLLDLD